MKIKTTKSYELTLTENEISELWNVLYFATRDGIEGAYKYYHILEELRPAGGFENESNAK